MFYDLLNKKNIHFGPSNLCSLVETGFRLNLTKHISAIKVFG